MQSKILTSCLMAGVLMVGGFALRAADTNTPAPTPPGATSAPQQGPPPRVRPLPGGAAGGPMAVLTEEQRASYQKNITDKRSEMMELTSKLQASRQEINQLMFSLKVDESQIRQKMMEEANIEADMMILRAKAFANIQPPMTAEQFEKFKEAQAPRPMIRPMPPTAPSSAGTNSAPGGPGKQ